VVTIGRVHVALLMVTVIVGPALAVLRYGDRGSWVVLVAAGPALVSVLVVAHLSELHDFAVQAARILEPLQKGGHGGDDHGAPSPVQSLEAFQAALPYLAKGLAPFIGLEIQAREMQDLFLGQPGTQVLGQSLGAFHVRGQAKHGSLSGLELGRGQGRKRGSCQARHMQGFPGLGGQARESRESRFPEQIGKREYAAGRAGRHPQLP
jgi:hypothetical protein